MTRSDYVFDVRERIANNIRFFRQERGWTQAEMANTVGVAENSIYLLENPRSQYNVPLVTLAGIAHAVNIPISMFLAKRQTPPNPRGHSAKKLLSTSRKRYEVRNNDPQRTEV